MPKPGSIILLLLLGAASSVGAQALAGHDDNQSWNDVQLTIPLAHKVDFVTQLTLRFGKDISRLNEQRIGVGLAFKPAQHWTLLGGYQYIYARNALGHFRREDRFDVRAIVKYPLKGFGFTHRSVLEYRFRRVVNSWTYRAAFTIDHKFKWVPQSKLFLTDEVFRDSLIERFSRNRFSVGMNKVLTKLLSVDIYYLRQSDGLARPGNLNVIGTSWKIHL
ncbi:MAG: DUF2490 domain-containing protein [Pyrinomonadaceae bacterium]